MPTSTNNRRSEPASRQAQSQSRVGTLREQLRELAVSKGPGYKLPSVREICAQFDTNWITLRSALDQLEADHVIDRRQGSGVYVSPKVDCKRIHIILDSHHFQARGVSPFWGMFSCLLIDEAQKRALVRNEEHRFHMVTSHSLDAAYHEQIIRDMERTGIDAALLIGNNSSAYYWLEANGIPCVSYATGGRYQIGYDHSGFIDAIEVLAGRGCRNIAIWNPASAASPTYSEHESAERNAPFVAAFERLGLTYNTDWMIDVQIHGVGDPYRDLPTFQHQGYQLARDAFGSANGQKPDALVIQDDMMTSGVLVALAELGIEVGRDVRIATNANAGSPVLFGQEKRLILVEVDPAEIVRAAFDLLDAIVAGTAIPDESVKLPYCIRG